MHWPENVQDFIFELLGSISAKEDKGFVSVDLLPQGKLINSKNFLQLVTLITIGPTEEEAVVRKDEVSDFWCTPTNGCAI